MGKSLFIAEKPSVAMEFARALKEQMTRYDGFQESEHIVITWCVGHLVTMSYPEVYDEKYRRWSLDTLPFIPDKFRYEVIPSVKKQFEIVKRLLNRDDVEKIYVCTDSGREGEYIYRLVASMAGVSIRQTKDILYAESTLPGGWTGISQVDFTQEGAFHLSLRWMAGKEGDVSILLDDWQADPCAQFTLNKTDDWQETLFSLPEKITGVHDLYFRFSNPQIMLAQWQFGR